MDVGGRAMQEQLPRVGVAYMDVGKGREQERKLEGKLDY
jgi:hypothetical protein